MEEKSLLIKVQFHQLDSRHQLKKAIPFSVNVSKMLFYKMTQLFEVYTLRQVNFYLLNLRPIMIYFCYLGRKIATAVNTRYNRRYVLATTYLSNKITNHDTYIKNLQTDAHFSLKNQIRLKMKKIKLKMRVFLIIFLN